MSHPVNDTVADQVLDEYYKMSAHDKTLYLIRNKLYPVFRRGKHGEHHYLPYV